jgi:hypothetical protein
MTSYTRPVGRAGDPDSLNPNPDTDPAFRVNPDLDPIQIQGFDDLKLFLIKNCNLIMSKLQEKPSAFKREHPALQKNDIY